MMRIITRTLCAGLATAALLAAAPFWVEKPYSAWNQEEVTRILSDSPWVRAADVEFDPSGMPAGPGGPGGPGGGPPGMGRPGMGGPGMGGPAGMGGPGGMRELAATVMWRSALPVRQAMLRAAQLKNADTVAALQQQVEEEPAHHILAVMGLPAGPGAGGPPRNARPQGEPPSPERREEMRKRMEERMLQSTSLQIGDARLAPEKMETVQSGDSRIIVFYFPKSQALTGKEKAGTFVTQMGPLRLTAKFKPKEMLPATK